MKFLQILALLLTCLVLLTACGGDVTDVERAIGDSEHYSRGEIAQAMDQVEVCFQAKFDGCRLLNLRYDEESTAVEAEAWALQYGADEAIVLLSDFRVDESGGDGSLNPDSTYRNWKWILIRNRREGWELKTWGYG